MKKIPTLILLTVGLLLATLTSFAQATGPFNLVSTTTGLTLDTVTNAGTRIQVAPVVGAYSDAIAIQATFTKISGTPAATAQMQVSLDGTNYETLSESFSITNVATAQTHIFYPPIAAKYFRITCTGTGTAAIKMQSKILARRK